MPFPERAEFFLKKQPACKPGSVFHLLRYGMSVIYLDLPSPANSEQSTPRHRASNPTCVGVHDLTTHQAYGPPAFRQKR